MSQGKISNAGVAFFSSLCASTFGLGCWQTKRYFEKVDLIRKREEELSLEPTLYHHNTKEDQPFRRLLLEGTFVHENEIYIGPRSLGASSSSSSSGPNKGHGGLSTNPQGYYVMTPFVLKDNETVLINRGWIPRQCLQQDHNNPISFHRPTGIVQIMGVVSKAEEPRFFKPPSVVDHRNPKILLWTDLDAIREKAKIESSSVPILTAINTENENSNSSSTQYPIQPLIENVGEFKVTPPIHAGYAVTWLGLSGAGVYMTRKLITKGR